MKKTEEPVVDFLFSKGTMTQKFTAFLKKRRRYSEFIRNLKEHSPYNSLKEFVDATSPYDLIYATSKWKNTSMVVGSYFPVKSSSGEGEFPWDDIEYSWRYKFCEGCEDPECLSMGSREHCYYKNQPFDFK